MFGCKGQAAIISGLLVLAAASTADAQRIQGSAVTGKPFGVASLTFPAQRNGGLSESYAFRLEEAGGRALYPVFGRPPARRFLQDLIGIDVPAGNVNVMFLFRGEEPLDITVYAPRPVRVRLRPQPPTRRTSRLLSQWWRNYHAAARRQASDGDHPTLIHDYLTSMLQRRLRLPAPLASRISETRTDQNQETLELLLGLERIRAATMKETIAGSGLGEAATAPRPADIAWPEERWEVDPKTPIEPIAARTPHECFYMRFGSFSNYLWLEHLLDDYGGDLSRMITLRGHRQRGNEKVRQQLALKTTVLSKLFGDQVIKDVAIIGRDLYLDDGAALGMLFEARNGLLGQNLAADRKQALKENEEGGATLETVKIGDRDVSFLSTPDNRIRSFYVADGNFHLVATSREIVRRFLETGADARTSLGASGEFLAARAKMPLTRKDTVFVYMSRAFFQGLVSPQYQIELARRLQAATDLDLLALARLAAAKERQPLASIDELIAGGFLPRGFGRRPDGGGPILLDDKAADSRRGARGFFTPIPDVEFATITPREADAYARKAEHYTRNWKQLDPLMVGVKRWALDRKGRERVVIDARVAPLNESKYGWLLSILGPPTDVRILPAPNDILHVQAVVQGGLLDNRIPLHHMFVGVQDNYADENLKPKGLLKTLQFLAATPGYLGAWPKTGFLDWLPLQLGGGPPDALGYSRLPFGIWRRQFDGFSLLSFQRPVLDFVTPHILAGPTDLPAQVRVTIGDLTKAKIQGWVNSLYRTRAEQATVGNLRLMHALNQQLGVPVPVCKLTAEQLLDTELTCTLGGEYVLGADAAGRPQWQTTARLPDAPVYSAPILAWFQGLESHLTKTAEGLVVKAELDMQRKSRGPQFALPPLMNFFGGGKAKAKDPAKASKKPAAKKEAIPPGAKGSDKKKDPKGEAKRGRAF